MARQQQLSTIINLARQGYTIIRLLKQHTLYIGFFTPFPVAFFPKYNCPCWHIFTQTKYHKFGHGGKRLRRIFHVLCVAISPAQPAFYFTLKAAAKLISHSTNQRTWPRLAGACAPSPTIKIFWQSNTHLP
ncbi:MAG: hypothetical protein EAY75_03365 [Bacteroidetes bacterium]|nr:MAG: hypothetical protein EAY75_03365 [Bacteroidota bacterium]